MERRKISRHSRRTDKKKIDESKVVLAERDEAQWEKWAFERGGEGGVKLLVAVKWRQKSYSTSGTVIEATCCVRSALSQAWLDHSQSISLGATRGKGPLFHLFF